MTVLRRGYVPVEPDPEGFDKKLLEQFAKQDPGGKAGKQIGGQLNRALKRVNLDPIDIKGNPKDALAKIELTEQKLRGISDRATTVEIKVAADRALAQLQRFKKNVGDIGADAGTELGGKLNKALADLDVKPINVDADPAAALAQIDLTKRKLDELSRDAATVEIRVKTQQALSDLSSFRRDIAGVGVEAGESFFDNFRNTLKAAPAATAATELGVLFAPALGAAIAGAVVGDAAVGGVVGGVVLAAKNDQVKQAGVTLGRTLLSGLEDRASGFVTPVLNAITRIRAAFVDLGPDLDKVFRSSRFVEPLTDAALKGAKGFLSGFADAIDNADPVVQALGDAITSIGQTTGQVFRDMSSQSVNAAAAIDDITQSINSAITVTGKVVEVTAAISGLGTEIDKLVDRGRYWLENHSEFKNSLDLTADGFKVGSAEAEAYRKATLGTADAATYATLKQAGMTDAQISAIDASGKYRTQLDEVAASARKAALDNGTLVASDKDVKTASDAVTTAQNDLAFALDHMNTKASTANLVVDNLKKAANNLYGPTMAAADANDAWQASWDGLTDSVKKNKGTLDNHTTAGRANRDALKDLIGRTNDLYYAEIATGSSVANATKKHNARIEAVKKEADKVGLDKRETDKLIGTYGKIPKKKTTDIVVEGVKKLVDRMTEIYILQRSLAEGIPIASARAELNNAPPSGSIKDFKAAGGPINGPGPRGVDSVPIMAAPGEHMWTDDEVNAVGGHSAMYRLREAAMRGDLRGYKNGGPIFPVDQSRKMRWPYDTDHVKVLSKAEARKKVVPQFDTDWPSSPSAQRGDSGVWRKVVALIKSTGPLSGHFGNAYRPGDPLWHGSGRAVDWMGYNQDALATFLAHHRPLELIHRTAQRDYAYTRGVNKGSFHNSLMEAHRNHVHIAMAGGGVIDEPVLGVGLRSSRSYSFGERGPETVTPGVGGTGDIHFHFHGPVASKKAAEDMVVEAYTAAKRGRRI
jgi:hypothetical protein